MHRTTLAFLLLTLPAAAQTPAPHPAPAATTALPVTSVSLYKNGVGFFEHTGRVTGNAAVTIDFTSGQLNDVLQSLTAVDRNGGRIAGAGYNSTTPLDQQLKNLPIALGETPTAADFYTALRGARVEVHSGTVSITGRLLAVEDRTTPAEDNRPATPRQFLTVVSDAGETRTLELTPATSVRLLDTALHTDVTRYLQLLDANRSQGLRHLTLTDNGSGTRDLSVSYISEVPIWKSTYRILLTNPGAPSTNAGAPSVASSATGGVTNLSNASQTATLQGWSVVDNTTGTDWINVHLSLIAGAPQSFIQPLSQPIYARRPEVPIAQDPQLTPQTFDSSLDVPPGTGQAALGQAGSAPGGVFGAMSGGVAAAPMMARQKVMLSEAKPAAPAPTYEDAATASLTPTATTAAFDDYFAYNLTEPVTLLKNTSALVPILQTKVPAETVTLVSSNGFTTAQPLRALWLTNNSGLTLDRGSFSIIEDGAFAGEGLLDPVHAGEKRLLSYAADQAVHVSIEGNNTATHIDRVTAAKGVLKFQSAEAHEITYVVHNAAAAPRTVVLEQPVVRGFVLDSTLPNNPDPKPTETTPTVYRFRLALAPGETARLHTGARRRGNTVYQLTRSDDAQLTLILKQAGDNPALTAALQPVLDARRRLADAQAAVDQTSQRLTDLRSDEDRQRANITALAGADKSSRDRFVRDLNATEDQITSAQKDLATRTAALDAAKADLATRIEALQIDQPL